MFSNDKKDHRALQMVKHPSFPPLLSTSVSHPLEGSPAHLLFQYWVASHAQPVKLS